VRSVVLLRSVGPALLLVDLEVAVQGLRVHADLLAVRGNQHGHAVQAGRREPLWEPGGKREKKVQVFPDQFAAWFGMELATGGRAAALLFPSIAPASSPTVVDGDRALGEDDFVSGSTEDRYPDHFGLAHGIDGGGSAPARAAVADRLATLPHQQVVLSHDTQANTDFLAKLAADL
jgi:hypothetical protein